jgi:CubicO group peptidase (beta-lactamase class C family)
MQFTRFRLDGTVRQTGSHFFYAVFDRLSVPAYGPNFLRPIALLLLITPFFISCGSSNNKNNKVDSSQSGLQLPQISPLPAAEKNRLSLGCKDWFDSVLKGRGFNGGIVVAKKGEIVFEAYEGSTNLDGKDTVNSNTPFHIASVSKTFTAMAVLKLWQDGKLQLDDLFSKYFPDFNYAGVTIRTLLNHRSGLPNYVHFMEHLGWDRDRMVTNVDVLQSLISRKADLTDIAPANTRFTYCNTNYALLALLIEKLSGGTYATYLQQTFFKPLGMQHTFVYDTTMRQQVTLSYDGRGREMIFTNLDAVYGDKNIYSTPRDILQWDRVLYTNQLFSTATLAEAFKPYSNERKGIRNYGLGWRMFNFANGEQVVYHNGWWHGNNASFVRLLADSATIIVIGNKFNRGIYHAREMGSLFGQYDETDVEEDGNDSSKSSAADAQKKEMPVIKKPIKKAPKRAINKKEPKNKKVAKPIKKAVRKKYRK